MRRYVGPLARFRFDYPGMIVPLIADLYVLTSCRSAWTTGPACSIWISQVGMAALAAKTSQKHAPLLVGIAITGPIPPRLIALSALQCLDLSHNEVVVNSRSCSSYFHEHSNPFTFYKTEHILMPSCRATRCPTA